MVSGWQLIVTKLLGENNMNQSENTPIYSAFITQTNQWIIDEMAIAVSSNIQSSKKGQQPELGGVRSNQQSQK
jgi:hypothetical protein